jgi:hypothetical protein
MRKFDDQEAPGATPAVAVGSEPVLRLVVPRPAAAVSASDAGLKALVDFAIGRGYYERWNSGAGPGVTHSKTKDFPTDKNGDSH